MTQRDDPNPLPSEMKCGNCPDGTVHIDAGGEHYHCDSCEWEMNYDDMKATDLFAAHLLEQYPDLSLDDWNDCFDDQSEDEK